MRRRVPKVVLVFIAIVILTAGASFTIQAVAAVLIPTQHTCGGA